jgi:hypothetical protein
MLPRITKIKLELMAYETMFATKALEPTANVNHF